MSERLPTCPKCGSHYAETVTIHNPETSDLNANATLKCCDCDHQWEGQVTSPRTEEGGMGWGPF